MSRLKLSDAVNNYVGTMNIELYNYILGYLNEEFKPSKCTQTVTISGYDKLMTALKGKYQLAKDE